MSSNITINCVEFCLHKMAVLLAVRKTIELHQCETFSCPVSLFTSNREFIIFDAFTVV